MSHDYVRDSLIAWCVAEALEARQWYHLARPKYEWPDYRPPAQPHLVVEGYWKREALVWQTRLA